MPVSSTEMLPDLGRSGVPIGIDPGDEDDGDEGEGEGDVS